MNRKLISTLLLLIIVVPFSLSSPSKAFVKELIDKEEWKKLEKILVETVDNDKDINSAKLLVKLSNAGHIDLHEKAFAIVMNESVRGDAYSSKLLGNHYYFLRDSDKAIYFYKRAAALGDIEVIAPIISIFVNRRDIVSSYTWASIGNIRGLPDADKSLRDLNKYISEPQKKTALRDANDWLTKYFKK